MDSQEVYDLLEKKGFNVIKTSFGVLVSLNRSLSFQELGLALENQIDQSEFTRISDTEIFVPTEQ